MKNVELEEEMEMPCPCSHCDKWFDLHDGYGSEKWYPNVVICEYCFRLEEKEIERDDNIREAKENIDEALYSLKENEATLIRLGLEEFKTTEEKQCIEFYSWICHQVIAGRTTKKLWLDYKAQQS